MNFFNRQGWGRTLLLAGVAVVSAVCWLGCGDDNPADNNGGGDSYDFVEIGGLKWMTKNMNIAIGKSWCYGNDNSNCDRYGRLYDWNTARGVCPSGWYLPNSDDMSGLSRSLNEDGDVDAAASLAFCQLGSGYRDYNGNFISVSDDDLVWWVNYADGAGFAYVSGRYSIIYDKDDDGNRLGYGFSVRCVSNL